MSETWLPVSYTHLYQLGQALNLLKGLQIMQSKQ